MNALPPILVIKLGALGDIAQAFGAFAAIRAHHPGQRIVLLTTPPFAALFAACPWFDAVWTDARRPFWRLDWVALRRRIRAAGIARVYDLQTSSRSDWLFRLLGPGRRPDWVGRVAGASHRHVDPRRDLLHTQDRLAGQLAVAGVVPQAAPDLGWLSGDVARFGVQPPVALLVPGAAPHRPAKRWNVERFAAVAVWLAGRGIGTAVLGAAADAPLGAAIAAAAPGTRDLTGRTGFADLVLLGRVACLAIGNDTGPMHWLAAAGTQVLTLFSAESDPALCAPRGPGARWLRRPTLADLEVARVIAELESMLTPAAEAVPASS